MHGRIDGYILECSPSDWLRYQIQQTAQNYVWKHCSPEAMKNTLTAALGFDKELSQPELETSIERHENNLPPVMNL
jgi:hypothetical protein